MVRAMRIAMLTLVLGAFSFSEVTNAGVLAIKLAQQDPTDKVMASVLAAGAIASAGVAIAGGVALTVFVGVGTLGLGFLGLGIPLIVLVGPACLLFDEHGKNLHQELAFLTPSDLNAVGVLLAIEAKDSPGRSIVRLPEAKVKAILDRGDYSKKDELKAFEVLSR